MNEYGLTIKDFDNGKTSFTKTRAPIAIKYRDDVTGHTWTGRGREPKWLKGKDKNQYLVK